MFRFSECQRAKQQHILQLWNHHRLNLRITRQSMWPASIVSPTNQRRKRTVPFIDVDKCYQSVTALLVSFTAKPFWKSHCKPLRTSPEAHNSQKGGLAKFSEREDPWRSRDRYTQGLARSFTTLFYQLTLRTTLVPFRPTFYSSTYLINTNKKECYGLIQV